MWGATMAVEEINAKGGIMGHKIEAFFADNKGTPGEAVSAVRKLADVDKVDVIIGQTHSGACLGAMPIVKEIGVPRSPRRASNPKIREMSGEGGNEWQFRVNIDDAIMANTFSKLHGAAGEVARRSSPRTTTSAAAPPPPTTPPSRSSASSSSRRSSSIRGQADYRPLLTKIKRANPDADPRSSCWPATARVFLRQYRELGLKPAGLLARQRRHRGVPRPRARTTPRSATAWSRPGSGSPALDPEWDKRWLERWKTPAAHPRQPRRPDLQVRGGAGHRDRAQEVRQGRPEDDPRRARSRSTSRTRRSGPIKFDDHHQAWINMILIEMKDGQLAPPREDADQPGALLN